jgi:hypothetical protein
MKSIYTENVEKFISTAESYLGYTARLDGTNIFGERTGFNGRDLPWDGSFIDVVARESGTPLPAFVYTPVAMSAFISNGRLHVRPKRGDIAFFETSTNGMFGTPHVGIVSDVSKFASDGVITLIEAQVSSGLPKGSNSEDGVYRRVRHGSELMGFARPLFKSLPGKPGKAQLLNNLPVINAAQVAPNMKGPKVTTIQLALAATVGASNLTRGLFDNRTMQAFAKFQRRIGIPGASGHPNFQSLQRLAKESGLFIAAE